MSEKVTLANIAYLKIMMHGARYPYAHIGGYLIGVKHDHSYTINDVLPICHGYPVGPILELAGNYVEVIFSSPNKILGYYFGNEQATVTEVPMYVTKVIEKIQENSGSSLIVQLRSDLSGVDGNLCVEGTIAGNPIFLKTESNATEITSRVHDLMTAETILQFQDFENHMDSKLGYADFRNSFMSNCFLRNHSNNTMT
jgi:hypothetical protein